MITLFSAPRLLTPATCLTFLFPPASLSLSLMIDGKKNKKKPTHSEHSEVCVCDRRGECVGESHKECVSSSVSVFVWRMQSVTPGLGRSVCNPLVCTFMRVSVLTL